MSEDLRGPIMSVYHNKAGPLWSGETSRVSWSPMFLQSVYFLSGYKLLPEGRAGHQDHEAGSPSLDEKPVNRKKKTTCRWASRKSCIRNIFVVQTGSRIMLSDGQSTEGDPDAWTSLLLHCQLRNRSYYSKTISSFRLTFYERLHNPNVRCDFLKEGHEI